MGSILKNFAQDVVKETKKQETGIQMIYYQDIKEADINRELRNIEELADDILRDGLEQNLLIRPIENDVYAYELVAGHRRYAALNLLIEKGHKECKYIPCKITELDDLDATRRKILNNLEAEPYTVGEMISCIEELKHVFTEKKKQGIELTGRIRELIADEVGLKPSQVGVYEKVINNAIPEVRKKIEDGELSITAAAELASLNYDDQLLFIQEKDSDEISVKTIKEYKESLNKKADVPVSGTIEEVNDDVYEEDDTCIETPKEPIDEYQMIEVEQQMQAIEESIKKFSTSLEAIEVSKFDMKEMNKIKSACEGLLEKINNLN